MEEEVIATSPPAKRHVEDAIGNMAESEPPRDNPQSGPKQKSSSEREKNSKYAHKERKEPKPMSCRRSAASLIHMSFNREYSIFEVTQKRVSFSFDCEMMGSVQK
ncbi:hypothetical protein GCK32_001087 [Trichostrongylus colubriformis]|uniref:Uncharacterized protein n=1 Tax=Trichostrongylus colubriformis TaxID=6319 RepID=A0AAN8IBU5_TRICO